MPKLTVLRGEAVTTLDFDGQPILSATLRAHGVPFPLPCGGFGRCGQCEAELADGNPTAIDEPRAWRRVLACRTRLTGDCTVRLPDALDWQIETQSLPMRGTRAGDTADGASSGNECHDAKQCGAAQERSTDGTLGASIQRETSAASDDADRCGQTTAEAAGASPRRNRRLCAAVDLGTTTLALALIDRESRATLGVEACVNPQTSVAADVMGRMTAALNGGGEGLRAEVERAIATLLRAVCEKAGVFLTDVESMVLAGNTTMLYLLTGRSPASLACTPFHADCLFGLETSVCGLPAYLPPCMSAFVGADSTCAVLSTGLCERAETALLLDLGTNGELALWHDGRLTVASTAAGPAFEGAGLSCGCGSVNGAIDRVWLENGRVGFHVIGADNARQTVVGLCGSGLIDLLAALLRSDAMDQTGLLEGGAFRVTSGIVLTQQDVRAVQCAKAAIRAGVEVLLQAKGVDAADVSRVYLAGGFGSALDPRSAAAIGLLPRSVAARAVGVGNASLAGAALMLDASARDRGVTLAQSAELIELGGNARFAELFIARMAFG